MAAHSGQPARVRLQDVAAVAGVSVSTASKALNDSAEIPATTRARVLDAAARLKYRPNAIARSLRGSPVHAIGVLTNDEAGVFSTAMVRGIEKTSIGEDYSVFLCNTLGRPERERQQIQALLDKRIDGAIFMDTIVMYRPGPAGDLGTVPCVFLYCHSDEDRYPSVVPDDVMGARQATEHLISHGRKRIAFANGSRGGAFVWESVGLRLEGYRRALQEAGQQFDPSLVRYTDWTAQGGYFAAAELLDSQNPPDAIFGGSDFITLGILEALRERQLGIGTDVAVIGFDDQPYARELPVPLTTVKLPHEEMGQLAFALLLDKIAQRDVAPGIRHVPTSLTIRNSCGCGLQAPSEVGR